MIDARDQIGVPIITDCPSYATAFGVTYEIPADAFAFQAGPIVFQECSPNDLMDKLRNLHEYTPYVMKPRPFVGFTDG